MKLSTLKAGDYLSNLSSVRWVILIMIIFGHASTMPRGPESLEYLTHFGVQPAWIGTQLLFVFAGFLSLKSLHKHGSAFALLKSRATRVIPMLGLFTAMVVIFLFPLMADTPALTGDSIQFLIGYSIQVISCFDASTPVPGLFENSPYKCQVQGILWIFRWGVVAYIVTGIAWRTGLLKSKPMILGLGVLSTAFYVSLHYFPMSIMVQEFDFMTTMGRFAYAWTLGMAIYAYRDRIKLSLPGLGVLCFSLALQWAGPWTPMIEVTLILCWAYALFMLLFSHDPIMGLARRLPDWSLGLLVFHWPVLQILLELVPAISPMQLFIYGLPITVIMAGAAHILLVYLMKTLFRVELRHQSGVIS